METTHWLDISRVLEGKQTIHMRRGPFAWIAVLVFWRGKLAVL